MPAYLDTVKRQIQKEYDLIREIEEKAAKDDEHHIMLLTDSERDELLVVRILQNQTPTNHRWGCAWGIGFSGGLSGCC